MSNHLEWIEIENFKCFDKLRVEGLERVNLIGGDNNVGKTAFMEACFINAHSKNIQEFKNAINDIVIFYRGFISDYHRNLNGNLEFNLNTSDKKLNSLHSFKIISNIRKNEFKILEKPLNKEYHFLIDNEFSYIDDKFIFIDTKYNSINIKFLPTFGVTNYRLIKLFSSIQLNRQKKFLNKLINYFDNRIEEFDFINNTPKCFLTPLNDWQDLSELGDGLKRFITIICAIWASRDGTLFIDEIENGIHYTKLPKLWEIIFKTSKEANCQVFATTHSKETIEAFNKIQFKLNEEESAYFEFVREDKTISTYKIDRDELEYSLKNNEPLRGESK